MILSAFVLYYGYFALFEALWAGQTPGKRVIGIRVIVAAGRPLSGLDAVLRNVLRIIDQLPGMYAVGLLAIFLTERNQRLGDLGRRDGGDSRSPDRTAGGSAECRAGAATARAGSPAKRSRSSMRIWRGDPRSILKCGCEPDGGSRW